MMRLRRQDLGVFFIHSMHHVTQFRQLLDTEYLAHSLSCDLLVAAA